MRESALLHQRIVFYRESQAGKDPLTLAPFQGGRCEKIGIFPLTLPSPARGEGKYIEIQEEIPSPSTGEGQGGGENGIFSHLRGGKGGGDLWD
jgi:hypothetical protein